jgi:S-adenosylmethionine decarboxylase
MQGLHLTADLHDCSGDRDVMIDPAALRVACLAAVRAAGLAPVGELFHRFETAAAGALVGPTGVTGVVLLAESHVAVHTWPEIAAVTLDVYVCNYGADNSARARAVMDALTARFDARRVDHQALQRGALQR